VVNSETYKGKRCYKISNAREDSLLDLKKKLTVCVLSLLAFKCFSCLQLVSQVILLAHESGTLFVLWAWKCDNM